MPSMYSKLGGVDPVSSPVTASTSAGQRPQTPQERRRWLDSLNDPQPAADPAGLEETGWFFPDLAQAARVPNLPR